VDAGRDPFSADMTPAFCDLLLPVLPALVLPVRLLFDPLPMLPVLSFAVAPLSTVVDEALCCDSGTFRDVGNCCGFADAAAEFDGDEDEF